MDQTNRQKEKFGTVLGYAPGNVPVYSSDYSSVDDDEMPDRHAYNHYIDDVYMGHKWQCVEFARRWLYLNRGYVFDDITMAHDIFRLKTAHLITNNEPIPLYSFRNGSLRRPEPGSLLIYDEGGVFEMTGHVAIITEVSDQYIRIAEQNADDLLWPEGQSYAREIKAKLTPEGHFWLECSSEATILGWVIQSDDSTHAEIINEPEPALFNLQYQKVQPQKGLREHWLNMANADEAAYVKMMGGHRLANIDDDHLFYIISESALAKLRRATNELHALYMHATEYVLKNPRLQESFNIPEVLWPRIQESWNNRQSEMITGRFDFALSERGIKVFEYNCDSASCYLETGKIQGSWATHYGCDIGEDPGEKLFPKLKKAWRKSGVKGLVHILQDNDPEETYHALFMQEAMSEAGIVSKILHGLDNLSWAEDGAILDPDGEKIHYVWKTWAWETALDQIREECDNDPEKLKQYKPGEPHANAPRLVDVLLRSEVMVYEPLWTLIPSNKAISPVLWEIFPDFPFLLESSFELTDSLTKNGYVIKPIVGRGGANITLLDKSEQVLAETSGRFDNRDQVYQQLFRLPKIGGNFVQISTFTVCGRYAAASTRVDKTPVINMKSDCVCLRVVEDSYFKELLK